MRLYYWLVELIKNYEAILVNLIQSVFNEKHCYACNCHSVDSRCGLYGVASSEQSFY